MTSSAHRASLLLATSEMPRHLSLVLAALERQTLDREDCEILICDDGSGEETRELVRTFSSRSGYRVEHLWQENQGFRKCRILNEAIRKARGEWLIFLDGDCVPHPAFLSDHLENARDGFYQCGRRIELGPWLSATLDEDSVKNGFFEGPSWRLLKSCLQGDSQYFQRSIRVPWKLLRGPLGYEKVVDLKGCNFSVARNAMLAINGFDEAYEGYGREDTDVELRLQNLGLKIRSLRGLAIQYHVWHARRGFTPSNDARLDEVKRSGRIRCERGINPIAPGRNQ